MPEPFRLNYEEILERMGGCRDILDEVAAVFLEHTPRMLDAIENAIRTGDAPALRNAAHSFKGAVANFGVEHIVAAAQRLETMGSDGDLSGAAATFSALKADVGALTEALTALGHAR